MKRTVVVTFGNSEARRYEIEHDGHDGPGGYAHPREDDYVCAAKRRLLSEGFKAEEVKAARYHLAS
ncbi:MAG: hypothetical protein WA840_12645 [Caulobacteraceae bacterium]